MARLPKKMREGGKVLQPFGRIYEDASRYGEGRVMSKVGYYFRDLVGVGFAIFVAFTFSVYFRR